MIPGNRSRRGKESAGPSRAGPHPRDLERFARMGPLEQRRMIREGMDATIVERVATNLLHLSVPTLLVHISLPCSTILRRIKRAERLTASESDRIARVLFVLEHAREVFASAELAAEWMQRGNATLDGLKPLEVLDSQPGYDRVRALLLQVTHGVAA